MSLGRVPCLAAGNGSNALGKMEDIKEFVPLEMLIGCLTSHQGFQICFYQDRARVSETTLSVLKIYFE